ncbi:TRAP transporter substrate-binding protein [Lysobacter sp. HA18]
MNTRRVFLAMSLGAAASAVIPRSWAAAPMLLRAADVHVDHYPTVEAVRFIGRYLRERTGGRIDTLVYHSGQLGSEANTISLTRFDALAMSRVYLAAMNDSVPSTRILSLPFIIDSTAHLRRVLDGPVGTRVLADFDKRDLVGLAFYDSGSRSFYNTQRPIHEPSDLHGLKIRTPVSEIFVRLVHALGANATPLPFGEIFSGLQTRLIDGAENNIKSFSSSRHFEVAKYWSRSEHTFTPDVLIMSRKLMNSLPPRDRDLIREAAAASVPYMRGLWDKAEREAATTVTAGGVRINEVDREAMRRATLGVARDYLHDPVLARLHEAVRGAA